MELFCQNEVNVFMSNLLKRFLLPFHFEIKREPHIFCCSPSFVSLYFWNFSRSRQVKVFKNTCSKHLQKFSRKSPLLQKFSSKSPLYKWVPLFQGFISGVATGENCRSPRRKWNKDRPCKLKTVSIFISFKYWSNEKIAALHGIVTCFQNLFKKTWMKLFPRQIDIISNKEASRI